MKNQSRAATWLGLGLLLVATAACDEGKASAGGTAPSTTAAPTAAGTATAAAGAKHDPPIEKDAVPAGHWYCDMGTVHYSQPEKGDGTCPTCHMKLVQK